MKLLLLSLFIILIANPAFSQITSQKIYTINERSLWNLGDKNRGDTTSVLDSVFTIKLDTAGMGQDSIIISAKKIVNENDSAVTGLEVGKIYPISKNTPLTLSFILGKIGKREIVDIVKKTRIQYKLGTETLFKEVLMVNLADTIIALSQTAKVLGYGPPEDSSMIRMVPDTTDRKEVRVVFLQRGETKTIQEKQNEETIALIKKILSGSGTKQAIGWFTLKKNFINVYQLEKLPKKNNPSKSVKKEKLYKENVPIKIVHIDLSNGAISKKGISVQLNHEDSLLFRNQQSPVTVYGLRHRKNDKLYVENDNANLYIKLGDLFYYNYERKFHYPDNASASLSPAKPVDSIYNYTEFNDIIDVTVYTDLLALVGRKPNGIIQTQLSGKFITNTGVARNANIIPFNFIQPYFRLSKFDSRFSQIDTNIVKNDSIYNKLFLSQVSYLQAGTKLNFFRFGIGANQELLINGGIDVNLTSADSLFNKDISFVNYYPEIVYRVNGMENFGLDLSARCIYQVYAKNSPFANRGASWIFNPQVTAYYSPFSNKAAKIYLRYANFAEIDGGKYNFGQFQFGLKTNLFKKEQ